MTALDDLKAAALAYAVDQGYVLPVNEPPTPPGPSDALKARIISDQYDDTGAWIANDVQLRDVPSYWSWATQAQPGILDASGKYANPWLICGQVAGSAWVPGCKLQVRNMRMFALIGGTWTEFGPDTNLLEGYSYAYTSSGAGGGAINLAQSADYAEIDLDAIKPASAGGNGANVVHVWKGGAAGWWPKPQYPQADAFAVVTEARIVGSGEFGFQCSGDVVSTSTTSEADNPPLGNPNIRQLTSDWQRFGITTLSYADLVAQIDTVATEVTLGE